MAMESLCKIEASRAGVEVLVGYCTLLRAVPGRLSAIEGSCEQSCSVDGRGAKGCARNPPLVQVNCARLLL